MYGAWAALGAGVAYLVGCELRWMGCLFLIPILWRWAPDRWAVGALVAAHYTVMAREIPAAYVGYHPGQAPWLTGAALGLLAVAVLALPWLLLWHRRGGYGWRLPVLLGMLILPPVGLIGWGHPLLATAAFLPGWSLAGLVLATAALTAVVSWPRLLWGALPLIGLSPLTSTPPPPAAGVLALHTQVPGVAPTDYPAYFSITQDLIRQVRQRAQPGTLIVAPESVAGLWSETTQAQWQDTARWLARQGTTLLLGADVPDTQGRGYTPALVALGQVQAIHAQQVPVPLVLWRPWAAAGRHAASARLSLGAAPAPLVINGRRVIPEFSICGHRLLITYCKYETITIN